MTKLKRSAFVNLKKYDIVLTSSFEFKHGVSGHLFEMIDYYYAIKHYTSLSPCILLSDGTTIAEFHASVQAKYTIGHIEDVFEAFQPKVIISNNIIIVDGSHRLKGCEIFAKNIFAFRCSESDFSYFDNHSANFFLLQDWEVYDEKIGIDYNKKLLLDKYKTFKTTKTNTAMFYLTTTCRQLSVTEVNTAIEKYKFPNNIILTNDCEFYAGANANVFQVPTSQPIWTMFDTYIYTNVPRGLDCSPRFIVECKHYGKDIIYDIDYTDKGLEARKKAPMEQLVLTKDDYFLELLNEQINSSRD